jgi:hypothetical protein
MPFSPLPIIRGTSTALYPFTQTFITFTGVSDSQSANPVRWVQALPIVQFALPYKPVTLADKNTLRAAFVSAKGQFVSGGSGSLSVTTDIEYDYLSFDDDEFGAAQPQAALYGTNWTLTQTLPQNLSPGTAGTAYPTIGGHISKLPYTQKERFQTIVSKSAFGPKYTFAEFAGGLTNFPSTSLMGWEFDEVLTDTEVATKVAHFLNNWGRFSPFQFTDEGPVTYSNVYYAADRFTIERLQFNQSRVKTVLIQMN